jgi:hypothetical protein
MTDADFDQLMSICAEFSEKCNNIFQKMRETVSSDEEAFRVACAEAAELGADLRIDEDDDTNWENSVDDELEYASVIRTYTVTLGGEEVATWNATYVGFYGCMGAGWWTECLESEVEDGVSEVCEAFGLDINTPDIPEPRRK